MIFENPPAVSRGAVKFGPEELFALAVEVDLGASTLCLLWPEDHLKENGYGWASLDGKVVYAHRWAAGFPELQVGHLCHDEAAARGLCSPPCLHRRCVRRAHLGEQTAAENLGASATHRVARRDATVCSAGLHEMTEENTAWESKGKGYRGRKCRACRNARERSYR